MAAAHVPLSWSLGGRMSEEVFQPTDPVPESGIYQVLHYRHRLSHEVNFLLGERFPVCSECGSNVRFRLVHVAPLAREDRNLGGRRDGRSAPTARPKSAR